LQLRLPISDRNFYIEQDNESNISLNAKSSDRLFKDEDEEEKMRLIVNHPEKSMSVDTPNS
jgi:hypothetical protein